MEAEFSHLLKHLDLLEEEKDEIVRRWMDVDAVKKRLNDHQFSIAFFSTHFATKVVDYALSVVKEENRVGNCPVMGVMLVLFKKKNIPLNDIFIICVNLKNIFLNYFLEKTFLNRKTLEEINTLMDYNFEGVIKEYVDMYYLDWRKNGSATGAVCGLSNVPEMTSNEVLECSEEVCSSTKVTSAREYTEEVDIEYELLDELNELESEVLAELELSEIITEEIHQHILVLFDQYSRALNSLFEFQELSYTITVLADLLHKAEIGQMEEELKRSIAIYLKAIINDLHHWKTSVFIEKSAEDIHYLDKTLLSSIAQLEIMLMPSDNETEEVEFF